MRRSPEAKRAAAGQRALAVAVERVQDEHDLSDVEVLQALTEVAATKLKYMLRAERHPDRPGYPADAELGPE
jgi:hypothetical protein